MTKILFENIKGELIFSITLDLEKRLIPEVIIEEYRGRAAKLCYPQIEQASYDSLESLFNHYCDTKNIPLAKLIEHIREQGFYTPYNPNLRIKIE